MAEIDVVIIDPGGDRIVQRLDNYATLQPLITKLVERLGLPREISFYLIPRATGRAMKLKETLASIGVVAGAELELKPARDEVFVAILDELYKKAEKYVADQAWSLAKEKLEILFRLDRDHPDPKQLRVQVEIHIQLTLQIPPLAATQGQAANLVAAQATGWGLWGPILLVVLVIAYGVWHKQSLKNSNNEVRQTNTARYEGYTTSAPPQYSEQPRAPQYDWDKPFSAPQYLVHGVGYSTVNGYVSEDAFFLVNQAPQSRALVLPDGKGGTYNQVIDWTSGPLTTPREVCGVLPKRAAGQTLSAWGSDSGFDCSQLLSGSG